MKTKEELATAIRNNRYLFITAGPGLGLGHALNQVVPSMALELFGWRASQMLNSDVERFLSEIKPNSVVILEEMDRAYPGVQTLLVAGVRKLPESVKVIFTGENLDHLAAYFGSESTPWEPEAQNG